MEERDTGTMPEDVAAVYNALYDDLAWLFIRHRFLRQLYHESDERRRLLRDVAPAFFTVTRHSMVDDIFMRISRLTDPKKSAGKSTASIQCMVSSLSSDEDKAFVADIEERQEKILKLRKPIRKHRDERIAHYDYKRLTDRNVEPLPPVSMKLMEEVLQLVQELFNEIEDHFDVTPTLFQAAMVYGDGQQLADVLEHGMKALRRLTYKDPN